MAVEIADEELEGLRGAAARTQQLESELQALRDEGQESSKRYRNLESQQAQLIGQVQAYIQQQGQQQRPAAVAYDDNEPIVERRQWHQEFDRAVKSGVNPVLDNLVNTYGQREQMHAQRNREQAKYLVGLKSDLAPFLEKYDEEIEAMVSSMPLDQQGSVKTYENAVKAVKALHVDEVADDRVRQLLSELAPGDEDDDDEDEMTQDEIIDRRVKQQMRQLLGDRAPKTKEAPARQVSARAPMPQSTRAGGSQAKQRRPKYEPLDRTERYFAQLQGLTDEDYRGYGQDLTRDIFGFRDPKTGAMRSRV